MIIAMLGTLSHPALAEVESVLRGKLTPTTSAAERRVAELGFLAQLLEAIKPSSSPPSAAPLPAAVAASSSSSSSRSSPTTTNSSSAAAADRSIGHGRRPADDVRAPLLTRSVYEARQPKESPASPTAAQLLERFGSWPRACRSAYGLLPDGRSRGGSSPWTQPLAGKRRPRYEIDDVRASIRRCARDLGRVPSAGDYHLWAREAKAKARATGGGTNAATDHPRIPGISVVYRLFMESGGEENRWRAALADVGLTEVEVAEARTTRLLGVTKPPTPERPTKAERESSVEALPLHRAIERAREQGGSLDWLAKRSLAPGTRPAADSRFSPQRLREARERRGVTDGDLRTAVTLQVGPWRRMLAGKIEPTFGQLVKFAAVVGVVVDELVSPLSDGQARSEGQERHTRASAS